MFQLYNVTHMHTLCNVCYFVGIWIETYNFRRLVIGRKIKFQLLLYIYNRLWISFSDRYTIRDKDEGKHSEDVKA